MKSSFTCILALLLITAAGCGGSDAEPLRIVATAPAAGATGVEFRAPVLVTFDAPVELAGIPADGWMVEGPAGPVAGSLESEGAVVRFTPAKAWVGATQYRVRLAAGVTATDGRRLGSPVSWTFETPYPSFAYEAMGPATFVYRIDPDSGRLEPRGQQILQGDPRLLAVHPGGHRAYASSPSGDVTAYEIDSTSGWLHAMGEPVATAVVPRRLVVDPQGRWLFVLSLNNQLVLRVGLDTEDGSLAGETTSTSITYPMDMALHPTEPFLFVLGATVDSYRLSDAGIEGPVSSSAWTFDPLGRLTTTPDGGHVLTGSSDSVVQTWTVDAATGVLTALPSTAAAPASPRWPAMHPTGEWLFTVERSLGTITPHALDARTGTLGSPEPPAIVPANPPIAIAVDPSGRYLYQQGNTTVG
ncbi:MAG: beta-propeller fold lactonase family protein, partial [Planctomycetes bacterium]|nr:beta-propeller fold lactonase family protein [Planctomycetota bacterium]